MTRASVIIPVYNGGQYLADAVRSMQVQSLSDIEIIVVDDGSSDGSVRHLELNTTEPRLRIHYQENIGLAHTLNKAVSLCNSEIIVRMDADDMSAPTRIQQQVEHLERSPNTVLVGGQIRRFADQADLGVSAFPTSHDLIVEGLLKGKHVLCHPSVAFRKEAFNKVGGYWSLGVAEDWDFFLKMSQVGNIENLPAVLLNYRFHADSINSRSMKMVRRNVRLACLNYENRRNGYRELDEREFDKTSSFRTKCRIQFESNSLTHYRRYIAYAAGHNKLSALFHLLLASLWWPAAAVSRIASMKARLLWKA